MYPAGYLACRKLKIYNLSATHTQVKHAATKSSKGSPIRGLAPRVAPVITEAISYTPRMHRTHLYVNNRFFVLEIFCVHRHYRQVELDAV